jgi:uncharacterized protein YjbJ (UPF0337 family)
MGGMVDKAKGRLKEAAGALTDDDKLRRAGKLEQTAGTIKEKAGKAIDAVKDTLTHKKPS